MPLNNFIPTINRELEKQFPKAAFYGLAQSIPRTRGSVIEVLPGYVAPSGEIKYVGIDDKEPMIVYHKLTGIQVTNGSGGFGDDFNDTKNVYSISMFVYHDVKRTMQASDLFMALQASFPAALASEPYKQILVRINNVILNSEQIFSAEYRGADFKLPATNVLFQLNYTIESSFRKGCFEKLCPEDIH